jgi:hypothetical protein
MTVSVVPARPTWPERGGLYFSLKRVSTTICGPTPFMTRHVFLADILASEHTLTSSLADDRGSANAPGVFHHVTFTKLAIYRKTDIELTQSNSPRSLTTRNRQTTNIS